MKKILSFLLILVLAVILTGGIFILNRYRQNPEQVTPYPYTFSTPAPALQLEAPILIAGDEMGDYFSKFKAELAEAISVNLSSPIKIQSIAKPGEGLHRTVHHLKSLTQWPQILIYQGGSEEFSEERVVLSETNKIKENFKLFSDDRIETLLILYPWISRLIYTPVKRVILGEEVTALPEITEKNYLSRLETSLLLYRQQLIELVNLSKNKNSLLILTTTPLNLDIPPKKVCSFTSTFDIEAEILDLKKTMEDDPKSAYSKSSRLILMHTGNAELLYLHGQISKRLGYNEEGIKTLLEASAYDCWPWRATEVFNTIIRSVAREHQVILFDFALMVNRDWNQNPTFFDETHPQNLYYQRGMQQLGLVIKDILKL